VDTLSLHDALPIYRNETLGLCAECSEGTPMATGELKTAYAQNLWQLANIITGFSVAQVMLILITMNTYGNFKLQIAILPYLGTVTICIAQPLLAAVVWWCHSHQINLLQPPPEVVTAIKRVRLIQIGVLAAVGAALLVVFWTTSASASMLPTTTKL
jgi:hypothetical protein